MRPIFTYLLRWDCKRSKHLATSRKIGALLSRHSVCPVVSASKQARAFTSSFRPQNNDTEKEREGTGNGTTRLWPTEESHEMKRCSVGPLLLLLFGAAQIASAFVARGPSQCHNSHTIRRGLDLDRDAQRLSRVVAKSKGSRQSIVTLHSALLPQIPIARFYKTFPWVSSCKGL